MTTRKFLLYEEDTGRVVGYSSSSSSDKQPVVLEGQNFLEVDPSVQGDNMLVVNGELLPVPQETLEAEEIERYWKKFKRERNIRLQRSDWTQVPDAPVDAAAWAVYRQQLRDLPANTTDPRNVVWPEPPS